VEGAPTGPVWIAGVPPGDLPYVGFRVPEHVPDAAEPELPPVGLVAMPRPARDMPRVTFGFPVDSLALHGPDREPRAVVAGLLESIAGLAPGDQIVAIDQYDVTGRNTYLLEQLTRTLSGVSRTFHTARGTSVELVAHSPAERP
jgi:hypothetical protein